MMDRYNVLGMMSGTSLDGLDLAYCTFWKENNSWKYELGKTDCIPYDDHWRHALKNAFDLPEKDLQDLDLEYGEWLGRQARQFLDAHGLEVDIIGSHGHTVHHRPEEQYTLQIGDGQALASASREEVICDFRAFDVSQGGQGAPLVPIGDRLLFSDLDFCLNLGGISNISFEHKGERLAFDIGICNMLLNHLAGKKGMNYDIGGRVARTGKLNPSLLNALNKLPYYALPLPKSTGYEWFSSSILPILINNPDTVENQLHTSVVHIAEQIAIQIKKFSSGTGQKILITGGGAFNTFLIESIGKFLGEGFELVVPPEPLVAFKEALVFAFMAALKQRGEVNVLASVTGAPSDSSSGQIFYPK